MASEHSPPSPLSHFDSADLLNALSTGIILLDAQLCPIYANVAAQDLLAISLNQSRGRPFGDHLLESNGLIPILRRSIETGEAFADRELVLNLRSTPREPRIVDVTSEHAPATIVFVDNCYGELVEEREPLEVEADVM